MSVRSAFQPAPPKIHSSENPRSTRASVQSSRQLSPRPKGVRPRRPPSRSSPSRRTASGSPSSPASARRSSRTRSATSPCPSSSACPQVRKGSGAPGGSILMTSAPRSAEASCRPMAVRGPSFRSRASKHPRFVPAWHYLAAAGSRKNKFRFRHPYFGYMPAADAVYTSARHIDHHRAQIMGR